MPATLLALILVYNSLARTLRNLSIRQRTEPDGDVGFDCRFCTA